MKPEDLEEFFKDVKTVAVVGASGNKEKWGYKVFKELLEHGFEVYPVNPNREEIDGHRCYPSVKDLPKKPDLIVTVVKPEVTEKIAKDVVESGVKKVWMQPGSESKKAIEELQKHGVKVVYGMCIVMDWINR